MKVLALQIEGFRGIRKAVVVFSEHAVLVGPNGSGKSTILDALYGWGFGANRPHSNFDPLIGLNNAFGDMLLNFVMATMFIVLPTFWVGALGWVGVRAGTAIQGLAAGTRDAQAAGGRGAGVAMKAAK